MRYSLRCFECKEEIEDQRAYTCENCGGLLEVVLDLSSVEAERVFDERSPSVWKYKELLPVDREPITLQEGGTPLYRCRSLEERLGINELYVKHEGMNPTGSFKDRGMTVGVTKALEFQAKGVICASTGNTSASLAVYASRASLPAYVLLPSGKVALGKIAQALMHGAKVICIKGNFDDSLRIVREISKNPDFYLLNSINPFRLEGQKTIAFEIYDQMKGIPDAVVVPVGNAGNISAIFKGFLELRELGVIEEVPRMIGVQAEGASPIADAFEKRETEIEPVERPETIATAIRIGSPVNAKKALNAIYRSKGYALKVSDDEITEAQKDLARVEGIGVEPASASSLAGLKKALEIGVVERDEKVVCVTTGHLLKDPEEVLVVCGTPLEVEADVRAVLRAMELEN
jgi:threonine synthase